MFSEFISTGIVVAVSIAFSNFNMLLLHTSAKLSRCFSHQTNQIQQRKKEEETLMMAHKYLFFAYFLISSSRQSTLPYTNNKNIPFTFISVLMIPKHILCTMHVLYNLRHRTHAHEISISILLSTHTSAGSCQ